MSKMWMKNIEKVEQLRQLLGQRGEMTLREIGSDLQFRCKSSLDEFLASATQLIPLYETDGRPARIGLLRY